MVYNVQSSWRCQPSNRGTSILCILIYNAERTNQVTHQRSGVSNHRVKLGSLRVNHPTMLNASWPEPYAKFPAPYKTSPTTPTGSRTPLRINPSSSFMSFAASLMAQARGKDFRLGGATTSGREPGNSAAPRCVVTRSIRVSSWFSCPRSCTLSRVSWRRKRSFSSVDVRSHHFLTSSNMCC